MDVRWISPAGIETHTEADLPKLLTRSDGFVWVDIAQCDAHAATVLTDVFHFHPLSVRECQDRVPLPKIHGYPDHFFVVLHGIEGGEGGRLQLLELDQFVSRRYLVTSHGPLEDGRASPDLLQRETNSVRARMESG